MLLASPAAFADKFTFAFGVGDSVSRNNFSNSAYANVWVGSYDGRGATSGFYVSGNIGASYWRSDPYAVDQTGRPYQGNLNYRPQFWVLSVGPTKTISTNLSLYAGMGLSYRRSTISHSSAIRMNVNGGLMYKLSSQSSIHLTTDSVNRGIALAVGIRLL